MKTHTLLLLTLLFYPSLVTSDCSCKRFVAKFRSVRLYFFQIDQLAFDHSYSHENCLDQKTDNKKTKGARGKFKGHYRYCRDSEAKLNFKIKLRDWQPTNVVVEEGDLLDWSINTAWESETKSDWDDQCDEETTGLHYDPTIACSILSEHIILGCGGHSQSCTSDPTVTGSTWYVYFTDHCRKGDGTVKAKKYDCDQQEAGNTCEYGDLSRKLGQLKVQKGRDGKLFVQFKGVDKYFLKKSNFEVPDTDYSIIISKDGDRILCAKLMRLCDRSQNYISSQEICSFYLFFDCHHL